MADRVETREVDVLVVGGGCSGSAAAIQAARMGARVLVVEETPWLGGMLTAAGVSAVDGNEGALGGGLFGAFRAAMEDHHGGPEAVRSGWVSNTCFEPQVAAAWFAREARASGAEVVHGAVPERVHREKASPDGDRVTGVLFDVGEEWLDVRAKVTIDATEYGDVLHLGGVPYRLGRESAEEAGEPHAPAASDDEIQDLTMVATLQRFDDEAPRVPLPIGFDLGRFDCSTAVRCEVPYPEHWNHALHDWDSFLGYALLPGGRFMLNWPFHANDHPAQGLFGTREERARTIERAKERALAYVHYIQTELGHPEWGLATDVYPTDDSLPLLPYVRESRRVVPVRWLREQDVVPQDGSERNAVLRDGIAVGDYYLDHHHDKDHRPPGERLGEDYPANAPFQVPYSALVPRSIDGLLAAEKNIGATHIVNGCSRLQPVSMLIGQAAGAAAALASAAGSEPRNVDLQALQDVLLEAGCQVVPDREVGSGDPGFAQRQRSLLGR
ncbi:MAG: FAD-dependent oxidoreductase [Planctomycetota bacterium]